MERSILPTPMQSVVRPRTPPRDGTFHPATPMQSVVWPRTPPQDGTFHPATPMQSVVWPRTPPQDGTFHPATPMQSVVWSRTPPQDGTFHPATPWFGRERLLKMERSIRLPQSNPWFDQERLPPTWNVSYQPLRTPTQAPVEFLDSFFRPVEFPVERSKLDQFRTLNLNEPSRGNATVHARTRIKFVAF